MAFFFYLNDAPHDDFLEYRIRQHVSKYPNSMKSILRVRDTIVLSLHPRSEYLIGIYEKEGFRCGNYRFKITRLYPWNHPADHDARTLWIEHTALKMSRTADRIGEVHG
jgi:hypothetical protein